MLLVVVHLHQDLSGIYAIRKRLGSICWRTRQTLTRRGTQWHILWGRIINAGETYDLGRLDVRRLSKKQSAVYTQVLKAALYCFEEGWSNGAERSMAVDAYRNQRSNGSNTTCIWLSFRSGIHQSAWKQYLVRRPELIEKKIRQSIISSLLKFPRHQTDKGSKCNYTHFLKPVLFLCKKYAIDNAIEVSQTAALARRRIDGT